MNSARYSVHCCAAQLYKAMNPPYAIPHPPDPVLSTYCDHLQILLLQVKHIRIFKGSHLDRQASHSRSRLASHIEKTLRKDLEV